MTVTTGAPPASATAKQRAALELARRRTSLQVSTLARAVVDIDDEVGWARLTELGTRSTVTAQQSATVATTDLLNATLNAADLFGDITSLPGINPGRLASGNDVRGMFAMTRQVVSNRMLGGATFAEGLDASANKLVAIAASEPHRIGRDGQLAVGLADERFNRYRRVARGVTCKFCLMLATRGAVYLTAASAGQGRRYHAHCDCEIVLEIDQDAIARSQALQGDWRNAIRDNQRLIDAGAMKPAAQVFTTAKNVDMPLGSMMDQIDLSDMPRVRALVDPDMSGVRLDRTAAAAGWADWRSLEKVTDRQADSAYARWVKATDARDSHVAKYGDTLTPTRAARRAELNAASESTYDDYRRLDAARRIKAERVAIAQGDPVGDRSVALFLPSEAEVREVLWRRLTAIQVTYDDTLDVARVRRYLRDVEDLPAGHLEAVIDRSGGIRIVDGDLTSHPRWQVDKRTTAADSRDTWRNVGGVASPADNTAWVSTTAEHGSANVVAHEFGHVVDFLMRASDSAPFRTAYDPITWRNTYFDLKVADSGAMEAWAEGYASRGVASPKTSFDAPDRSFDFRSGQGGESLVDLIQTMVDAWAFRR